MADMNINYKSDEDDDIITETTTHKKQKINCFRDYIGIDQDIYLSMKHKRKPHNHRNLNISTNNVNDHNNNNNNNNSAAKDQQDKPITPDMKIKQNERRIRYIFTELLKIYKFRAIVDVIVTNANSNTWYCSTCRSFGHLRCGLRESKTMELRAINWHLSTHKHISSLSKDSPIRACYEKLFAERSMNYIICTCYNTSPACYLYIACAYYKYCTYVEQQEGVQTTPEEYKYDMQNIGDSQVFEGLSALGISVEIQTKDVSLINYCRVFHIAILNGSTYREIEDTLKSHVVTKAVMFPHYKSPDYIKDTISAMAYARDTLDDEVISESKKIAISEDGQTISLNAIRGYIIWCFHKGEVIPKCVDLMDAMRSLDNEYSELFHYDQGIDHFTELCRILKSKGKKLRDVSSVGLDGFSAGQGTQKGLKGRVKYDYATCITCYMYMLHMLCNWFAVRVN